MAKLKIQKTGNVDVGYPTNNINVGVTGGANGLGATSGANTILCVANIEYATGSYDAGDAYIVRQKGKHKYLVANLADPTHQQICVLVNEADANAANLTSGQMCIQAVDASAGNIALFSITDKHGWGFPTDYVSTADQGNLTTATSYLVSFVAANATVQSGSVANVVLVSNS